MNQSTHRDSTINQLIVPCHGLIGLKDLHVDAQSVQLVHRVRSHVQPLEHSLGQHDRRRSGVEQVVHVSGRDPRPVLRAVLAPLPVLGAPGIQLYVLEALPRTGLDENIAPGVVRYLGRLV